MVEYLQEVNGLDMTQDVIEYQQVSANGQPVTKKLPGVKKAGECHRRPRNDPVDGLQRLDQRLDAR